MHTQQSEQFFGFFLSGLKKKKKKCHQVFSKGVLGLDALNFFVKFILCLASPHSALMIFVV